MSIRKRFITCLLIMLPATSFSIGLEEVVVGGTYYHNAWNNNTKARVLGIRGQKVEIIYLEGSKAGEVDRVYPSDLLTRTDSQEEAIGDAVEGVALGVLAAAAFVCAIDPESCEENNSSSRNPYKGSTSYNTKRNLYFYNDCGEAVSLAITYKNQDYNWLTTGWWSIPAYEGRYLADDNSKIAMTSDDLYYYAEAKRSSLVWKGDAYNANFNGRTLGMRKTDVNVTSGGNYSYAINCAENDPLKGKYLIGFNGANLDHFEYDGKRYEYGVQVESVVDSMPASDAGLRTGDVIYKVDDKNVTNIEFLLSYINSRKSPWSSVDISYMRNGSLYSKAITPKRKR